MHPCTTDSNHPESSIGMEAQLVLASFLLCYLFLGQVRALLTFSTSLSIQLFEAADERNPTEHDPAPPRSARTPDHDRPPSLPPPSRAR